MGFGASVGLRRPALSSWSASVSGSESGLPPPHRAAAAPGQGPARQKHRWARRERRTAGRGADGHRGGSRCSPRRGRALGAGTAARGARGAAAASSGEPTARPGPEVLRPAAPWARSLATQARPPRVGCVRGASLGGECCPRAGERRVSSTLPGGTLPCVPAAVRSQCRGSACW